MTFSLTSTEEPKVAPTEEMLQHFSTAYDTGEVLLDPVRIADEGFKRMRGNTRFRQAPHMAVPLLAEDRIESMRDHRIPWSTENMSEWCRSNTHSLMALF